jgi:putative DNA methylase
VTGAATPALPAWNDRLSLIEVAFPAQKVSIETQCERKAGAGQTLTALGGYWKGRKMLVLVRACLLATLLPATDDVDADLDVFEQLMAMDDAAFVRRVKRLTPEDVQRWGGDLSDALIDQNGRWREKGKERLALFGKVLARMPYNERLDRRSLRPEELPETAYDAIWDRVNAHLGTTAHSHAELVEQLGMLRFGHRPKVGDTFSGSGQIPFEAARIGCDVYASDLNPIACMLTWAAFNVVGADVTMRAAIAKAQHEVTAAVDAEVARLGIEHDAEGNRAKAFLYCLETKCPNGWVVPLSGSWLISKNKRTCARLVPDMKGKRFDIEIVNDATDAELEASLQGTVREGDLVYTVDGVEHRVPIRTLRGDRQVGGVSSNNLRRWERTDVVPRPDDIYQERLYCIQWVRVGSESTFFRAPTEADFARERSVESLVREHLQQWQDAGLIPDMTIEPGEKTDEPIRTRGWTYWHHLFMPRHLLVWALALKALRDQSDESVRAALLCLFTGGLDKSSKLSRWRVGHAGREGVAPAGDYPEQVFYNQALNVFPNYAARSWYALGPIVSALPSHAPVAGSAVVRTAPAADLDVAIDIGITDPPYADAVAYEEITEYFIAWLRKRPPAPFRDWIWDSRRDLAIHGRGEGFRSEMVRAYGALAKRMPSNGVQIVMFTHQDAKVWGDMAGIFWGAGLRVTAAWYIATETTSELKRGGYVQGTVILVLRKRAETRKAYKDELVLEIRDEVARQIDTMVGLNQRARKHGRSENLFEDADLQMAGYAAALRVLTAYTQIDGMDMTREALRPRTDGEQSVIGELIEFAVAIANEHLVPEGLQPKAWERLVGAERFYLRMLDLEAVGLKKLDNYQNFAKAFRVTEWQPLLASARPNEARLKSAKEFKRTEFGETEFGGSLLRAVLFAVFEIDAEVESEEVMSHLRDNVKGYFQRRPDVIALADYVALKLETLRPGEAAAARVLRDLVKGERLGA